MVDVNIAAEKLKQLAAATTGLTDLERFAEELSAWVGGRPVKLIGGGVDLSEAR